MSKNRYNSVFSFRTITAIAMGVFVLTSSVTAEIVERYNAAGELTASGTDVAAVQTASGAAEGDVIKLSETATHNDGIEQTILKFTIQSATPGVQQTIKARSNGRLYNIANNAKTYNLSFKDIKYQGSADAVSGAIGLFFHTSPACTLDIKTDNVSFTGFKNAGYHGGVFGIDGSGILKITATNGLVFDSNRSNKTTGGAIHVNSGKLTITADTLTFNKNYATTKGGAIYKGSGDISITGNSIAFTENGAVNYGAGICNDGAGATITGSTILFDKNYTTANDGGAIYTKTNLTINGSDANAVTTINANYAPYKGGAIRCDGTLTLKTGTFNITNNYNTTASDKYSYGGAIHATSINTDAKTINFDSNKSTYYGGGLSVNSGTIKADTIIFNKNTSDNRGGAIFTNGSLTITGNTIKFTDNFANKFGGAIFNNDGASTLTINGKDVLFSGNHISDNDGGTIHGGNVTLNGTDASSVFTFKENYTKYYGAAINSNTVTLNTGTFNFTGNYETTSNSSYSYGGAISCTSFTADVKTLNFDGNTSKYYGGAIALKGTGDGAITLQADTITFKDNKADIYGGAIYGKPITVRGASVSFTGNQAKSGTNNSCGGAIYATSAVTFGQDGDFEAGYGVYTFSNNLCYYEGGAIFASGNTTLNGKSFTFSNNTAENWVGGAIRLYASNELNLTLNGETTFTGNTAGAGGGAIYTRGVITANQFATFENNTSASSGGAIYAQGSESIQGSVAFNKGVTFSGNTAVQNGGAIYAYGSVTFAGDGSEGTFTNNVSNNGVGNDLYLVNASSILTFQDAGTYSFDGGIYLNNAAAQTVINQAQVTIAGREGDDTNVYQLQNVNISNGGKLSAQLDNINSLAGNFTISDTPTEVALSWVGQTATIKSSTGYKSSFELVYGSIDPNLNSLDITSGRLDIKGDLTSSLTVKERATFSPGNSVGTLFLDGDFTAEPWSTLFIEQDENGIDQLIVRSGGTVNIDDNAVLELLMTNPVPNATYTIIDSEDGLTGKYATSDFWNGLLTSGSAYYWNMSVDGNKVYATIDPNAVPEPSTWALLILGAMGLLYWRNKN